MIDTSRLIINVRPTITEDGRMVLYDVSHEDRFVELCGRFAQDFFMQLYQMYLVLPGCRSNFYIEKVLPNYSLVLHATSELVYDDVYDNPN